MTDLAEIRSALPRESAEDGVAPRVVSPRRLMWWKFRRHKLAVTSLVFLTFTYLCTIFAGFVSPYDPSTRSRNLYAPPQMIRFIDSEGHFHLRPFVYGYTMKRDLQTLSPVYQTDTNQMFKLSLFVRGNSYKFLGLIDADLHLFGVEEGYVHLAGTDHFGRDMLTRLIYGAQISLSVGLVSVLLSLVLGLVIGGISGLYGGWVDNVIQRVIEAIIAIPTIPLWLVSRGT